MAPNPIVVENQKPGTPESVWQIDPGQDSELIQGFTTEISTNVGGTVNFKIDNLTSSANYHIDIYRIGYYGGDGATHVTTLQHNAASEVVQPAPLTDPSTGLVDAGNWSVTDSWVVPTNATSGVYVANVIDGSEVFQIPFIIRNDGSTSNIVFQTDDETWQAYNSWGGSNVYGGEGPGFHGAAYAVSYNRPITTRDGASVVGGGESGTSNDMVFSAEFPAIEWMEENGYDVSYVSGIDVATNGSLLLNHQVYMEAGHDEYWTDSQRANVQAAADAGVNLVFMSGNEMYWQTRLAPSIDSAGDANRTLVTYKDTHANTLIDPSGTATGTFMDARFASTGGMSGDPSNSLTGTVFQVDDVGTNLGSITIPYGETNLRIWRNTAVANTAPGQSATLQNLLGYEWDSAPDNGSRPPGEIDLSTTTLNVSTDLLDYGNTIGNGTATHNVTEYRDPISGALVFSAGTVFWSWGLSDDHDTYSGDAPADPSVQQAMVNLLADMGVQPETLQATLKIATQSTDHTAPTALITQVSATNVVEGESITASGTASDSGGVIAGVEVSSDGGKTWHPATSPVGTATVNWTYTFKAGAPGTNTIEVRATDDSLNTGRPSSGISYTSTPSSNLTIFSPTDTPAQVTVDDPHAVELGMKFTASVTGEITGIRFYKGPQNTGTHIGDLWSSNGTLLASGTFTDETATGWQQVNFATPVLIQAGTTYIASYHTDAGDYSASDFFFDIPGYSNGALSANGTGLNGVYAYGAGPLFPNNVSIATGDNYWVDVVFNDTSESPQAINDSGFSVNEDGSLTISGSALLANDSDPNGLALSMVGVSNPSTGTVSYNQNTDAITFVPAIGFAGSATFNYTIRDTSGTTGTGQVAVAVNIGNEPNTQNLFRLSSTPAMMTVDDNSAVELGVQFTASANGTISGIRFYKDAQNVGPHVADLWSSTGTLLATATFSGETSSGWQQVNFSSPVAVTAGTTYVASYHTDGFYSADPSYFNTPLTSGQLTATNGVFAYGASPSFPTSSFNASNYWVDVIFNGPSIQPPLANSDSGLFAAQNGTFSIAAATLLANDSDPNGFPLSITGVSDPTNGTVTYNSTNQTISFVPTPGYLGPAGFSYTVSDGPGTASANVSLTVVPPPPIASDDSGYVANENSSLSIASSSLLANDSDPNGLAFSITDVGNASHGTVAYDSTSQTVTFTPAGGYTGTAEFSYSISATNGGVATGSVSLIVNDPASQNLFSLNSTPSMMTVDDNSAVELGVQFTASANGTISGIRFYKDAQNVGPHIADLWSSTGTLLATATFSGETSSGWQQVNFSSPVAVTAGATYVASYHTDGFYSADPNYFSAPLSSDQLTATNGVFAYGANPSFPTGSFNASNYWVDVIFNGAGALPPVANSDGGFVGPENGTISISGAALLANDSDPNGFPLSITGVSDPTHGTATFDPSTQTVSFVPTANYAGPATFTYTITDGQGTASANVALGVSPIAPLARNDNDFVTNENNTLSISASTLVSNDVDPSGLPMSIASVSDPTNGTVSYDANSNTVNFVPDAGYTGSASFKYSVTDSNGGVSSPANVSLLVNDPATVSLFDATQAPSLETVDDPSGVELGFKFQTSTDGQITGIRFYKDAQNVGTHTADLWSSTGTLIASATFTNETTSGWQQVNFSSPVSVTAGTTYVASYHTDGNYSADPNFFATDHTNGPLTAPSSANSGGNGIYAYGSASLFPASSFNATGYGVDVLFKPQLAS